MPNPTRPDQMRAESIRSRPDRCPGVLRPWIADDGALTRIRVPGGQIGVPALSGLAAIAERHGDGLVHVTSRANLQLRALPLHDGALPADIVAAIEATGLLPSREHDRIRNILVSPQTGLAGGLADLRPIVAALDRTLLADERFATLPGRFLFTLDDGRGDLRDRHRDLGLIAVDGARGQLRVGGAPGAVVTLDEAAEALGDLTDRFLAARGDGPDAPWHVAELPEPLIEPAADLSAGLRRAPLPYGAVPGGTHVDARAGLSRDLIESWASTIDPVVLTPWHGVLIPEHTA